MGVLLIRIFFCFLTPSAVTNVDAMPQNEISIPAEEAKNEERTDTNLENILFGSGVGLVAVGGIGAGVIAHNNNKPKDVPSKTIEGAYSENDKDKERIEK